MFDELKGDGETDILKGFNEDLEEIEKKLCKISLYMVI